MWVPTWRQVVYVQRPQRRSDLIQWRSHPSVEAAQTDVFLWVWFCSTLRFRRSPAGFPLLLQLMMDDYENLLTSHLHKKPQDSLTVFTAVVAATSACHVVAVLLFLMILTHSYCLSSLFLSLVEAIQLFNLNVEEKTGHDDDVIQESGECSCSRWWNDVSFTNWSQICTDVHWSRKPPLQFQMLPHINTHPTCHVSRVPLSSVSEEWSLFQQIHEKWLNYRTNIISLYHTFTGGHWCRGSKWNIKYINL